MFYGKVGLIANSMESWADFLFAVNEVLGDHNVDKQMTDSRGDVCLCLPKLFLLFIADSI